MRSLRRRYLIASAGVIGLLLVTVGLAYQHVSRVTEQNHLALTLAARVSHIVDGVPDAVRRADHELQYLLAEPSRYRESAIAQHLHTARMRVADLLRDPALAELDWHDRLGRLERSLSDLAQAAESLLDRYDEPGWLYPALPLIAGTMFEANTDLDTGLTAAIKETGEGLAEPGKPELHNRLVRLRGLWRRMILNFRSRMIRFAGLPTETLRDDSAMRQLYQTILDDITALEQRPALWRNSFETAELVPELRGLAGRWFADYHRVRALQASGRWRGDIAYVTQVLRPLQGEVGTRLLELQQAVSAWSAANAANARRAAADINYLLWVLAALALGSLLLNYLILDRGLLRPVAEVSEALSAHAEGRRDVALPAPGHREIAALVDAFENLRAQIQTRQQALEHQALHDVLTGLPNRALLRDRLEHGLRAIERDGGSLGLLLLDLDRFKEINDSLGHHTGDQVLREVARRLIRLVRESDTVARLGGDEFATVLPGLDRKDATELAQRIATTLGEPYRGEGEALYLGASVGVVVAPEDGNDPATLMRRADNAMYSAKHTGADWAFYDPGEDQAARQGMRLAGPLRSALAGGPGLSLHYQPRMTLLDDRIVAVEALLQWQDPGGEEVPAERLVRFAERSNLIHDLTRWVLDRALADCAACIANGVDLGMAVNLSPRNLADEGLVDMVREALQRHGLPGTRLTLEITENAVMTRPERARAQLEQLAAMGVQLSIDDFGTGFSSLAHLSRLPVHEVKIDKSFVLGMAPGNNDALIVRSIVELARNLGLRAVAEGVELPATLARLRELGCDEAQGYLISRALPLASLQALSQLRSAPS